MQLAVRLYDDVVLASKHKVCRGDRMGICVGEPDGEVGGAIAVDVAFHGKDTAAQAVHSQLPGDVAEPGDCTG